MKYDMLKIYVSPFFFFTYLKYTHKRVYIFQTREIID